MSKRNEFIGSIPIVRKVEDCVRATKKYTKGAFSKPTIHPIQGEDFPSRLLTEYYEVYPDLELSWDMNAGDAWAWVWGDIMHIDLWFQYDYRVNIGKITVQGGNGIIRELERAIPGFREALQVTKQKEN